MLGCIPTSGPVGFGFSGVNNWEIVHTRTGRAPSTQDRHFVIQHGQCCLILSCMTSVSPKIEAKTALSIKVTTHAPAHSPGQWWTHDTWHPHAKNRCPQKMNSVLHRQPGYADPIARSFRCFRGRAPPRSLEETMPEANRPECEACGCDQRRRRDKAPELHRVWCMRLVSLSAAVSREACRPEWSAELKERTPGLTVPPLAMQMLERLV